MSGAAIRWGAAALLVSLATAAAACGSSGAASGGASASTASATQTPATGAPAAGNPAASAPATPPPLEHIKVSFASDSAIYMPHFIAIDKGYYQEEGIDMEIVRAGGGAATPAVISGEVQYSTSAATALSAMLKGAPLKVIYTNTDRSLDELWTTTDSIRTLADLIGKSVGIQTRGDTMEIEARLMFLKRGLDPNQVSYSALGIGNQRLAALETGVIPAAVLAASDVAQIKDGPAGPRAYQVADYRNEIQMLYTGLAANDQELRDHKARTIRFLRGTVKGREYYKAFKDETLAIMDKVNDKTHSANEVDYDVTTAALTPDGSMPIEVQRQDAIVRAQVNDVDQIPPVEQMYDYSLIKAIYSELQASGWKPTR